MDNFRNIILILFSNLMLCSNINGQYDDGTDIYYFQHFDPVYSPIINYAIEDFDGDLYKDIITTRIVGSQYMNILLWFKGDGSGNFTAQSILLRTDSIYSKNEIFYDDMNEDGIGDVIFQNSDIGFTVLFNDGLGNISNEIDNAATAGNLIGADLKEIADVDGDGDMDGIFWAKTDSLDFFSNTLGHCLIGYNNGTGILSNYSYLDNSDYSIYHQIKTGDIDGDGDLDIICNGEKSLYNGGDFFGSPIFFEPFVRVYRNIGLISYAPKEEIELTTISDYSRISYTNIKVQNINADGSDELLVEYHFTDNCEDDLHWWGCEDFNQFQVLDYSVQNDEFISLQLYNSWLHGYYNTGSSAGSDDVYNNAFHIQFGHQNTDNNLDILSVNVPQGRLQWYLGDGNGGFNNTQTVNFNNQYSSTPPTLRVADIDNDTDLDIFVLLNDYMSSNLTVFKNLALAPTCAPLLDLVNTPLTDGIYQAGITTISNGNVVAGNNNVVLKAGNNVKLQSGFKAPANSSVKIRISSCN